MTGHQYLIHKTGVYSAHASKNYYLTCIYVLLKWKKKLTKWYAMTSHEIAYRSQELLFLVRMYLILIAFCNSACFNVAVIWVSISFLSAFGCFLKYASEYKMHTPMYGKICILNANSDCEDLKYGSSSGSVLFIRIEMTFKDRNTSKLKDSTSDHLKYILGTGLKLRVRNEN